MSYLRKTRDTWEIQQYLNGQWEMVTTEVTWKATRENLKQYRQAQPEYPVRAVKKRERIE